MTDGPFDTGWGGAEGFGYLGVEHLGDGIDHVHVVYGNDDGLPQVLVALDVGGDADFVDDAGDHGFDAGLVHAARGRKPEALPSPDFLQPLHQHGHITGLQHQVADPQARRRRRYVFRQKGRCCQGHRAAFHGRDGLQHADAVLLAEHQIQHQHIRFSLRHHPDGLLAIPRRSDYLKTVRTLQRGHQGITEILCAVRNEYGRCMFHTFLSCPKEFLPKFTASAAVCDKYNLAQGPSFCKEKSKQSFVTNVAVSA